MQLQTAQADQHRRLPSAITALLGVAIALCFTAPASSLTAEDEPTKPNIVYILTDDLGWNDLSVYGQTNWTTPRLDQMAAEGMLFTQAYAGNTVCAPSRAALLTGNHAGRVWQRGNGAVQFRRDPEDITIATRLRDLGYRTAMIGKSGVACNSDDLDLPHDKGFEHFYGMLSHSAAHRNYPRRIVRNREWIELPGNNGFLGDTYANELWVADSLEWLDEHHDEPFFLHLSITPPHADLTVPEKYMAPFRGRFEETPNTGGYYHQQETRAAYAGMIAFIDDAVGRVLDKLTELGVAENTVVFFATDNGPHYEGGADPDFFDSNGPLRGGKRAFFEGGIRTPQIVWWPGTIAAGSRTDLVTAFWDFPATALDLAGADIPRSFDGISIAPTLLGNPSEQQQHEYLYWEFYEQGGKQAVRTGKWKGIRRNVNRDRNAPIELYDLKTDIGETTNIAERHPDVVARIAAMMAEAHTPSPIFSFENRRPRSQSRDRGRRRLSNDNDSLVLDRSGFSVVETTSASAFNGRVGSNVIDDDLGSWWHTQWRDAAPSHPHRITIDLGATQSVHGIRLMARQDHEDNGTIKRADVYVADSPSTDGQPAIEAVLAFTKNEQEVMFDRPMQGRYLSIVSRSAHADSPYACIANLEILGKGLEQ
ncbi:MAG: sulfatase-like hydrolase/transferase [Planctomycetota bacterium]